MLTQTTRASEGGVARVEPHGEALLDEQLVAPRVGLLKEWHAIDAIRETAGWSIDAGTVSENIDCLTVESFTVSGNGIVPGPTDPAPE